MSIVPFRPLLSLNNETTIAERSKCGAISQGMNDLATERFIQAANASVYEVPWVLPILIGAHRLTFEEEIQLIESLQSAIESSEINSPGLLVL